MSPFKRNQMKKSSYIRIAMFIGVFFLGIGLLAIAFIFAYIKLAGPPDITVPRTNVYLSANLEKIGENHGTQKRFWVPLERISPDLIHATLAVEDRNFYSHHGFDAKRIAGAILSDLKARAKVQGASTISQQFARNLFLGAEKTWSRKWKEAVYTLRIEDHYPKRDILEGYLNTIYYGHGMYGIQAASHYYFHKNASELTLAEASMLAGIPKGPSIYSPILSETKSKERQAIVLSSMVTSGYINQEKASAAKMNGNIKIYGSIHSKSKQQQAPYFLDAVNRELKTVLKGHENQIKYGGLKIYTTLDSSKQKYAEEIVAKYFPVESELQIAFVAMNPKNGQVKALIGGANYEKSPFNRATQALRQPGSTIKPILYYTALEKGFTPSTTLRSEETTFSYDDGRSNYTPRNFNNQYANDSITMAQALALSDNIFAVKTHLFLGESELVKALKRFGLTTPMPHVPSLALGTSGVKPIEMTNAYNIFANGGKRVEPHFITRIEGKDGQLLYERKSPKRSPLNKKDTYVMTQMLTGIFDKKLNGYASVTGATIIPKLSRPYAAKSGSTELDSWMIGYTPQLTAGVWTGYDQSQKLETRKDQKVAKEVWAEFMEKSLKTEPVVSFNKPKGVVGVYVDPSSGLLADKACPVKRLTYYKKGTEPTRYCPVHRETERPSIHKEKTDPKSIPWYKKVLPF